MKTLVKKIIKKLKQKKLTISCAESCTGGLLSSKITMIPNASRVFKLGLITYSNYAKTNILKVPKKLFLNMEKSVSKIVFLW